VSQPAPAATGRRTGPLWPWFVPFALFVGLLGLEPFLADRLEPFVDPRWLYAIRAGLTGAILLALRGWYVELRETPATPAAGWLLGAGVGIGVFLLWIVLDVPFLTVGDPTPYDPSVDGRIHLGFALTRLAGAALVVPVMEELFWRSFLMRWLERPAFRNVDPRQVGLRPLLLTSAVFALEHRLWFAGLLAGLVYGELYRRTGDLRVVILAHALTNALLGVYVLGTGHYEFW
jgi:CAAX prenyl protease-like protein